MPDQSKSVDELLQDASDSLFKPESLQDIRDRLAHIAASECPCLESPHLNALHDLADDDVPVLLTVIEQLAAEVDRLRSGIAQEFAVLNPAGAVMTVPDNSLENAQKMAALVPSPIVSRYVTEWEIANA